MSNFIFPNGIDTFDPVLINDLTVVNANHVNDLRMAILDIENAIVGITSIPYVGTSIVVSTDNLKHAIEKLDSTLTLVMQSLAFVVDGYDGYSNRLDMLSGELYSHISNPGPVDGYGNSVHGVQGQVVGTLNQQTIYNKIVDSGTTQVGPKFIARGGPGDAGLHQVEVYGSLGGLNAWIDEQGNAFFAGSIHALGDEILQDVLHVSEHLVVDGYSILGSSSNIWPTTINGNLTVNGSSVTINSTNTFTYNGMDAYLGNGTGSLVLAFSQAQFGGNVLINGSLSVDSLTNLGSGPGNPLTVDGNTEIDGNLTVLGTTGLLGSTSIGANSGTDNITITGYSLVVTVGSGNVTLHSNLIVDDNITSSNGTTYYFGNSGSTLTNTFIVNANVTIGATLSVTDSIALGTTLTVGTIGNQTVINGGNISATGNLSATGNTITLGNGSSTLTVSATSSSFSGNGSFGGNLSVTGNGTFGNSPSSTHSFTGDVTVSGQITVGGGYTGAIYNDGYPDHGGVTIDTNGNVSMDGKLTVKGPIDPISLEIRANTAIQPIPFIIYNLPSGPATQVFTIDISGNTITQGTLQVFGQTNLGSLIATGPTLQLGNNSGTLTVAVNNFNVTGVGSLTNISGNVILGSTLINSVQINGTTTISGNLTITGGQINGVDFASFHTAFTRHLADEDPNTGLPSLIHQAPHIGFSAVSTGIVAQNVFNAIEEIAGPGWNTNTGTGSGSGTLVGHINSVTAHPASHITVTSSQLPGLGDVMSALNAIVGSPGVLGTTADSLYTLTQALTTDTGHFADRTLQNLQNVAVNTSLLPASTNSINIGSLLFSWHNVYADGTVYTPALDVPVSNTPLVIGASVLNNTITIGTSTSSVLIPNNLNVSNTATINTLIASSANFGELHLIPTSTPTQIPGVDDGYFYFDNTTQKLRYYDGVGWLDVDHGGTTGNITGYVNQTDSTFSFTNGSRTFTIQPTGASFDYYLSGTRYNVTTAKSVVIPNVTNLYFIYLDNTKTLQFQTSFDLSLFTSKGYTATVYWNATLGAAQFVSEERHAVTIEGQVHSYLHQTQGTRYVDGLTLSTVLPIGGDGSLDGYGEVIVGAGHIRDEDIVISITDSALGGSGFFSQHLSTPAAQIPVFYRTGGSGVWAKDAATNFPIKQGTLRAQYNLFSGGSWSATDIPTDGYYGISWIFATNDVNTPIVSMLGQDVYVSLDDAQTRGAYENLQFGVLPFQEFKLLYRLIYSTSSAYANTPKAAIQFVSDYRRGIDTTLTSSFTPSDHGNLSGLLDDDHPQYFLLAGRAGGQIAYGGDLASDNLTLDSTSNGTKGKIVVNSNVVHNAGIQLNVATTQTANYSVQVTDCVVPFNTTAAVSPVTATLPLSTASNKGQKVIIKDVGGAINQTNKAIIIARSGSDTIDGQTSITLNFAPFSSLTLIANGSGLWMIV